MKQVCIGVIDRRWTCRTGLYLFPLMSKRQPRGQRDLCGKGGVRGDVDVREYFDLAIIRDRCLHQSLCPRDWRRSES